MYSDRNIFFFILSEQREKMPKFHMCPTGKKIILWIKNGKDGFTVKLLLYFERACCRNCVALSLSLDFVVYVCVFFF